MTRSLISRGKLCTESGFTSPADVMLSRCRPADCLPSELAQSFLLPRRQEDGITNYLNREFRCSDVELGAAVGLNHPVNTHLHDPRRLNSFKNNEHPNNVTGSCVAWQPRSRTITLWMTFYHLYSISCYWLRLIEHCAVSFGLTFSVKFNKCHSVTIYLTFSVAPCLSKFG